MKLHWSPRSPYVRKVMVATHELGLVERLTCVRSLAALTWHSSFAARPSAIATEAVDA